MGRAKEKTVRVNGNNKRYASHTIVVHIPMRDFLYLFLSHFKYYFYHFYFFVSLFFCLDIYGSIVQGSVTLSSLDIMRLH